MRIIVLVPGEAEPIEPAARHLLRLPALGVEDLKSEQHVCERRAPRHQAVALKNNADLAAKELEIEERIVAAHRDLTGSGLDQTRDQVEHGRLAAAGLAEHGDDLAPGNLERELVDREQVATAIGAVEDLADIVEADHRICHLPAHMARSEMAR